MFNPDQILFDHVAGTLPDSLSKRRVVLQALKAKLKHSQPAYVNVCAQIAALETIEQLQAQLPLKNGGVK